VSNLEAIEEKRRELELAQAQARDLAQRIKKLSRELQSLETPPHWQAILKAMQVGDYTGLPVTTMALSKFCQIGYAATSGAMLDLLSKGLVERPTRGYYRLTEAGRNYGK
jgi:hypothetical protein